MTDRPILFSAPTIRALLAGTKTQTRRVMKYQPHFIPQLGCIAHHIGGTKWQSGLPLPYLCPYGKPGDRLWVKETWRTGARLDSKSPKAIELACRDAGYTHGACCPVQYIADGHSTQWGDRDADDFGPWGKTRVSIHMPRWASRLTLEVVSVSVERLQDISEADAIAEGVVPMWEPGCSGRLMEALGGYSFRPAASAYALLWESINGASSWDANPWVWVVEFRRVVS